VKGNRDLKIN